MRFSIRLAFFTSFALNLQVTFFHFQDKDKLIRNLKTIQDYLCSFNSQVSAFMSFEFHFIFELAHGLSLVSYLSFLFQQGLTVVNISATTFPQTLDWLHGYLLEVLLMDFF